MENQNIEGETKKKDVLLPASIVIAGVLVAGSVVWAVGKSAENPALTAGLNAPSGHDIAAMRAVDDTDHVRGSRDADVMVVEYSDFECPFCKRFHDTMSNITDAYDTEEVAWVYRQYPIAGLHTKAVRESEASECAAELGGNDAFWRFADRLFEVTPSNDGLNLATLPDIAEYAGVARAAFESCVASGQKSAVVAASVAEVERIGIQGTPYVIFTTRGSVDKNDFGFLTQINQQFASQYPGQPAPFVIDEASDRIGMSGAYPREMVGQIIDILLGK